MKSRRNLGERIELVCPPTDKAKARRLGVVFEHGKAFVAQQLVEESPHVYEKWIKDRPNPPRHRPCLSEKFHDDLEGSPRREEDFVITTDHEEEPSVEERVQDSLIARKPSYSDNNNLAIESRNKGLIHVGCKKAPHASSSGEKINTQVKCEERHLDSEVHVRTVQFESTTPPPVPRRIDLLNGLLRDVESLRSGVFSLIQIEEHEADLSSSVHLRDLRHEEKTNADRDSRARRRLLDEEQETPKRVRMVPAKPTASPSSIKTAQLYCAWCKKSFPRHCFSLGQQSETDDDWRYCTTHDEV